MYVTKKRLLSVFLCCAFTYTQADAVTAKTNSHKAVIDSTVQESKQMTTKGLGMPVGKRVSPEDVAPVTSDGVRYEALHWGRERGLEQNGGYIVAIDSTSGKELWLAKIYTIEYKPKLETDVQDVFIQSIELSDDKKFLKVIDENHREFMLNLSNQKVTMH